MSSPSLNSLDLSSSTFQVLRHSHNLSETLEQFILTQKQQLTHRQHTHLQVNYVEGLIEEVSSQPKKRDEKSKEEILIEEFLSEEADHRRKKHKYKDSLMKTVFKFAKREEEPPSHPEQPEEAQPNRILQNKEDHYTDGNTVQLLTNKVTAKKMQTELMNIHQATTYKLQSNRPQIKIKAVAKGTNPIKKPLISNFSLQLTPPNPVELSENPYIRSYTSQLTDLLEKSATTLSKEQKWTVKSPKSVRLQFYDQMMRESRKEILKEIELRECNKVLKSQQTEELRMLPSLNTQISDINESNDLFGKESKLTKLSLKMSEVEKLSEKNSPKNSRQQRLAHSCAEIKDKVAKLTSKEKYEMDYVSYKKLRRKEAIEREVYDHTLRKRDRSMDKFQDYILTELKFKDPDRKKLEEFFYSMRKMYQRIESHACIDQPDH